MMKYKVGQLVQVQIGEGCHSGRQGIVLEIKKSITGLLVTDYPIDSYPSLEDAEAYQVGFPATIGSYKDWGWYREDQLEGPVRTECDRISIAEK